MLRLPSARISAKTGISTVADSCSFGQTKPFFALVLDLSQFAHHTSELFEGRVKVLNNLGRKNVGFGQAVQVLETFILEPEDIQVELVPRDEVLIGAR